MANKSDSVNNRLQNDMNGGSPQLKPDEQRRYLGNFRERVSLIIPSKDVGNSYAQKALSLDIQKHPKYKLYINQSQMNDLIMGQYLGIASKHNIEYDIESDNNYSNPKLSYAIVFANNNHEAINQYPILWNKKYPISTLQTNPSISSKKKNSGFWSKIKKLF